MGKMGKVATLFLLVLHNVSLRHLQWYIIRRQACDMLIRAVDKVHSRFMAAKGHPQVLPNSWQSIYSFFVLYIHFVPLMYRDSLASRLYTFINTEFRICSKSLLVYAILLIVEETKSNDLWIVSSSKKSSVCLISLTYNKDHFIPWD